ncbi:MAG: hypothetical protein LUO92_00710, partial [Methanothrix sp.]|nr:hypothetical protein [Methanothrix sp.]
MRRRDFYLPLCPQREQSDRMIFQQAQIYNSASSLLFVPEDGQKDLRIVLAFGANMRVISGT